MTANRFLEINLTPPHPARAETVLLDVVDPLIHGYLAGAADLWFYFWEWHVRPDNTTDPDREDLRLRVRFAPSADVRTERREIAHILKEAVATGKIADWYEGSHGERGKRYKGAEDDFYGPEVTDLTFQDWMSGSELAIAIIRHERHHGLTKPRSFHWSRRAHLYANQLQVSDTYTSLMQAQRYLMMRRNPDDRTRAVIHAIDRYLAGERGDWA